MEEPQPSSRPLSSATPEVVPHQASSEPHVHTIFEASTGTWQWIVADPSTKSAVIIDPVLDAVPKHNGICTTAADGVLNVVRENGYRVTRILETHTYRPHKTAAWYLRTQLGNAPRICTGKSIAGVKRMFARQYQIQDAGWSKHFDAEFRDGQRFGIGNLHCLVVQLTQDSFAFVVANNVFIGEMPSEQALKRLHGFTRGYFWHPGGGDERPSVSSSRPTTSSTTTTSSGDGTMTPRQSMSRAYSPLMGSPRREREREKGATSRPASHIHEMAG